MVQGQHKLVSSNESIGDFFFFFASHLLQFLYLPEVYYAKELRGQMMQEIYNAR